MAPAPDDLEHTLRRQREADLRHAERVGDGIGDAHGRLTGSLLDYVLPTASMTPELEIPHEETPSPVTPLGAKGVAEANSMSTPACIANAVADALGVAEVSLPLTPERLLVMVRRGGQ